MRFEYLECEAATVERLEVDCKLFSVRVMGSTTDKLELSWRNTTMRSLDVKQEDGTLRVVDHAAVGIYGTLALINLKKDDQLLIKLPGNYAGKAIFQSKSEGVHLSDLDFPGSLGVASNAGEILLENVGASKIDIRANVCKVNCYGVNVAETLDISSKSGHIQCYVDGTEDDYTVSCKTERPRSSATAALRAEARRNGRDPRAVHAADADLLGHGPRNVRITTETGLIDFAFQNGAGALGAAGRYHHENSFRDW